MSGVEAFGIVLAVLPLLISTIEHYDDALRPFKRYKNFDSELKRFKDELSSEKVIFHTESLLLLTSVTSYDIATKMLEERDHPSWKDSELEAKLSQWLGASRDACKNIIAVIEDDLKKIREESQFFDTVTCESSVPTNDSDKIAWRLRVGRKLKWSLSQSQLQKRLKDLRCHVKIFQRHSSQINRVAEKHNNTKHNKPQSTVQSVYECCLVQEAAAKLYQALINACKAHQEHTLHFRLETRHCTDPGRAFVRFHFAFIQSILTPNSSPVWVAIESEFGKPAIVLSKEGREKVEHSVQALRTHLKRFGDSTGQESLNKRSKKLTQKSVRFAESASPDTKSPTTPQLVHKSSMTKAILSPSRNDSPSSPSQSSSISNIATGNSGCGTLFSKLSTSSISTLPMWNSPRFQVSSPEGALPDFCQQHDLCSHITKWSKTTCGPTDACIGYLGREWPCSHRVLVTPQVTNKLETPTSLAQLISSSVNRSHSSRFLYVDSIRLAKQLASAILLFHATPMLSETWQSEDIVFYSTTSTPKRGRPKLNDPHLTVRITNTTTTTIYPPTLSETRQKKPLAYETHIRNPYTYRLGVILLELACQAPLSKLREEEDLLSGPKNASTDFEVANAISETLSTDMGIPFQKMVQKCLNCDFGSGTNLNDPGLQAAFHRDVVCELEDLENRLNRLQLGE